MTTPSKRYAGRFVVPVFLTLIAGMAGGGLLYWLLHRFPDGAIAAEVAVEGERVVRLREGYESRGYYHLTLESEAGEGIWSATLFGIQEGATPIVGGGLVTIQAREARGHLSTQAYRIDDGTFAWRAGRLSPELTDHSTGAVVADGGARLVLAYDRSAELISLNAEGTERWRITLPESPSRPSLTIEAPLARVVYADGTTQRFELATGVPALDPD